MDQDAVRWSSVRRIIYCLISLSLKTASTGITRFRGTALRLPEASTPWRHFFSRVIISFLWLEHLGVACYSSSRVANTSSFWDMLDFKKLFAACSLNDIVFTFNRKVCRKIVAPWPGVAEYSAAFQPRRLTAAASHHHHIRGSAVIFVREVSQRCYPEGLGSREIRESTRGSTWISMHGFCVLGIFVVLFCFSHHVKVLGNQCSGSTLVTESHMRSPEGHQNLQRYRAPSSDWLFTLWASSLCPRIWAGQWPSTGQATNWDRFKWGTDSSLQHLRLSAAEFHKDVTDDSQLWK